MARLLVRKRDFCKAPEIVERIVEVKGETQVITTPAQVIEVERIVEVAADTTELEGRLRELVVRSAKPAATYRFVIARDVNGRIANVIATPET